MDENGHFDGDEGDVYVDGSCFNPTDLPLSRAGFATVQMNNDGTLHKAIYGSVPAAFRQTSLAGEYASLTVAYEMGKHARVFADCADLVRTYSIGLSRAPTLALGNSLRPGAPIGTPGLIKCSKSKPIGLWPMLAQPPVTMLSG